LSVDTLGVKVDDLGRRVSRVEHELDNNRPVVLAKGIQEIEKDVQGLSGEVRGLRRAVIAFALTVAASAIGFAITVLTVWGGHK
jgi:hypothetical protein